MTHYDSYGNRDVFVDRNEDQPLMFFFDRTVRRGEHRYILWVHETTRSAVAQRRTYRSRTAAISRAAKLRRAGYGVRVADRMIRRGETGYLADRSGSYYRALDGTLHTGTFEEIAEMLRDVGHRSNKVCVGSLAPGESVALHIGRESER